MTTLKRRSEVLVKPSRVFFFAWLVLIAACNSGINPENEVSPNSNDWRQLGTDLAIIKHAKQFGPEFAEYILSHPNIGDNIECQPLSIVSERSPQDAELCAIERIIYEPIYVNKVRFFLKKTNGDIKVLDDLTKGISSSFSHFYFSENKRLLSIVFTDEGHPYFVFFDTQKFIDKPNEAQVGEVFEEYFLDHIESFYDNGDFVFALMEDSVYSCLDGEVEIEPATLNTQEVKRCLFHHNIYDRYSSLSSSESFLPSRSKRIVNMPYVCHFFR
jgi:hypothetical protein